MLDKSLRQSPPARITAGGFIVFILFGNFWLVRLMLGAPVEPWIGVGFLIGLAVAAIGGVGLGALAVKRHFRPLNPSPHDHETADDANTP